MRTKHVVSTLLSVLAAGAMAAPAFGETAGPVQFDVTENALSGTVSCNGGPALSIAPVDASTTDLSGSNTDVASNLSDTACGLPLYTIVSADDSTFASDTTSDDEADGDSSLQSVSLLGGVLTYQSKVEADRCAVVSGETVGCQDTTTVENVRFAGQPLTGAYTSPTTFNALNLRVQLPGACTGVALFTGSLTVASASVQVNGAGKEVSVVPIALKGTLTCLGLPAESMTVMLTDASLFDISGDTIQQPTTYILMK